MPSFYVCFHTDISSADLDIDAGTPEEALRIARTIAEGEPSRLDFDPYRPRRSPIQEIEVCDQEANPLATWRGEELQLRRCAGALLAAAEKVIERWETGDLAEAVRDLNEVVIRAKSGSPALPASS